LVSLNLVPVILKLFGTGNLSNFAFEDCLLELGEKNFVINFFDTLHQGTLLSLAEKAHRYLIN